MRALLFILALLVLLPVSKTVAQGPAMMTANFYLAQPEKWLGKSVSVNVAWLDVSDAVALHEGYKQLDAETFNSGRFGGYLTVLAKPQAAVHIIQICGTQHYEYAAGVAPHMIHGVFAKDGDRYVLKIEQ